MRKTISDGINRRAVYKFRCTGACGKIKSSYVYERAKGGICLTCSKYTVDGNQAGLFVGVDLAGNKDSSVIVMQDSSGKKKEFGVIELIFI